MSFQLILILAAIAALVTVCALRVLRVRDHRDSPAGVQQVGLVAGFLFIPPLLLQVLVGPKGGSGATDFVSAFALYAVALVGLWLLAKIAAPVLVRLVPIKHRPMLLLALTGRDTSDFVPFDPPMSADLRADVERVDSLNAEFPRGVAFMGQVSKPGFRSTWEALDVATSSLEARIAGQRQLHLGVAEQALATAGDARGRLDTLRRAAAEHGQAWAAMTPGIGPAAIGGATH